MEIKEYFKTGNAPVATSHLAQKCRERLCGEIRIGGGGAAHTFFSIKDDIKKVYISWVNETVHTYRSGGRRGSSFIMQKRGGFNLKNFIIDCCSFTIHNKKGSFRTMVYNNYYYQEICKIELAMYLHKYNEIYECEIIMIAIGVLFKYFTVFQKEVNNNRTTYVWLINAEVVNNCIDCMLGMHDFDIVSNYIIKYIDRDFTLVVSEDICVNSSVLLTEKTEPSRDDILSHIGPEMKPGQKIKAIMSAYGVSRRTVYNWFTKHKIETKSNMTSRLVMPAPISSKLEETNVQKVSELLQEIDRLRTEINSYKQQLKAANSTQKDAKIAELLWELDKCKGK